MKLGDDLLKLYYRDDLVYQWLHPTGATNGRPATMPSNALQKLTNVIQAQMNAGNFASGHMSGQGVDIRSKDKNRSQINLMMSTANSLGGKAIYESKPPHIHVSLKNWSYDEGAEQHVDEGRYQTSERQ